MSNLNPLIKRRRGIIITEVLEHFLQTIALRYHQGYLVRLLGHRCSDAGEQRRPLCYPESFGQEAKGSDPRLPANRLPCWHRSFSLYRGAVRPSAKGPPGMVALHHSRGGDRPELENMKREVTEVFTRLEKTRISRWTENCHRTLRCLLQSGDDLALPLMNLTGVRPSEVSEISPSSRRRV